MAGMWPNGPATADKQDEQTVHLATIVGAAGGGGALATEATVATLATEATAATLATEATVATLATEATLAALLADSFSAYDKSLFGGIRAHNDLPIFERLHDYPGATTAYDPDTYGFDSDGIIGSITHMPNEGALKLAVSGGGVGGKSRLRTHDIMRYQPGCAPAVNITGYGSAAATSLAVYRRTYVTGVVVDHPLSTINGYSAVKANRYEIRFAYLGVQGAFFFINGTLVHTFTAAGVLEVPYMRTANLPLTIQIRNIDVNTQVVEIGVLDDEDGLFFRWTYAVPAAISFTYKCASVRLIGGGEYPYKTYVYSRATTGVAAALVPLFSMRVKSTLHGINSRVQAFPTSLTFFSETQPGALELVVNPQTLTGVNWAATSPSGAIDLDINASAITIGTGESIFRVGQGQNQTQTYDLTKLFSLLGRKLRRQAFTGTADILTFAVQRESAVNFDPRVTLNWGELR